MLDGRCGAISPNKARRGERDGKSEQAEERGGEGERGRRSESERGERES